ncbi:MAG TPA: HK97 family phage prohead protease [Rhizobiaceae bacterium]|nr:HK97 family phage prohead protease [Rhizobiaceae bacterium]
MKTKVSEPLFDIKKIADDGVFSGYGSIFGNKDSGGDIVVAGAYGKSLAEHRRKGSTVKMFWQHDPHQPIGKWLDISEDGKGLFVEGKLNMGVQRAREAHALLKEGDIDGLSIGYRVIEAEPDEKRGALLLKQVHLFEVSVVSMAMNERARVESVKQDIMSDIARRFRDGEPITIKEFEDGLREAGFPKSAAVAIASHGIAKVIRSESEGEKANQNAARFLQMLKAG